MAELYPLWTIALAHNNDNHLPMFDKALVGIHVITKKEADRRQLWDVSNRALNLVINALKGALFPDDNFRHMSLMVTGEQGENEKTLIYVGDFATSGNEILSLLQRQIYGSKAS